MRRTVNDLFENPVAYEPPPPPGPTGSSSSGVVSSEGTAADGSPPPAEVPTQTPPAVNPEYTSTNPEYGGRRRDYGYRGKRRRYGRGYDDALYRDVETTGILPDRQAYIDETPGTLNDPFGEVSKGIQTNYLVHREDPIFDYVNAVAGGCGMSVSKLYRDSTVITKMSLLKLANEPDYRYRWLSTAKEPRRTDRRLMITGTPLLPAQDGNDGTVRYVEVPMNDEIETLRERAKENQQAREEAILRGWMPGRRVTNYDERLYDVGNQNELDTPLSWDMYKTVLESTVVSATDEAHRQITEACSYYGSPPPHTMDEILYGKGYWYGTLIKLAQMRMNNTNVTMGSRGVLSAKMSLMIAVAQTSYKQGDFKKKVLEWRSFA